MGVKIEKFRCNRKKIGLTYSAPKDAKEHPFDKLENPLTGLLEFLENLGGHCKYIIAKEKHKSGKLHYHCFLKYDVEIDTKNCRYFDFMDVHPNILKNEAGPGWQSYIKKDKDFITNMEENPFSVALQKKNIEEAMDYLWQSRTAMMATNADRIYKNMKTRMAPKKVRKGPTIDKKWKRPLKTDFRTMVFQGPSGIGKTQFAKAHFKKPLLVSRMDQVKLLDETHDGIVFDDMNFCELDRTAQIHLVDWDEERHIPARYNDAIIPAETKKIFTTNVMCLNYNDAAIARRLEIVKLEEQLFEGGQAPPASPPPPSMIDGAELDVEGGSSS